MKIVLIGGGKYGNPNRPYEIKEIDKHIVSLSNKINPKVLLVPYASSHPDIFATTTERNLAMFGCNCSVLTLEDMQDYAIASHKILSSDIIYVSGGNTLSLMTALRRYHIDQILTVARDKDIILCGPSAGAICWCNYGNSDSRKFTSNSDKLIKVKGLGFINALLCPHFDVELSRHESLKEMMHSTPKIVALAIDNCAAIKVIDNYAEVIVSKASAHAYKCYWSLGQYHQEQILTNKKIKLNDLLTKSKQ